MRRFRPTAVADTGLAVEAVAWSSLERARYAPAEGDGLAYYEPDGRIVVYDFAVENRGDETLEPVSDYAFVFRVDARDYDHLHDIGDGISFARVNQPEGEPAIRRASWYRDLEPGERADLQLVFEAPAHPDAPHYLVWYPDGRVEGAAEPAYLRPAG